MSYQIGKKTYDLEGAEDEIISDIHEICERFLDDNNTQTGTKQTIENIISTLTGERK